MTFWRTALMVVAVLALASCGQPSEAATAQAPWPESTPSREKRTRRLGTDLHCNAGPVSSSPLTRISVGHDTGPASDD